MTTFKSFGSGRDAGDALCVTPNEEHIWISRESGDDEYIEIYKLSDGSKATRGSTFLWKNAWTRDRNSQGAAIEYTFSAPVTDSTAPVANDQTCCKREDHDSQADADSHLRRGHIL